VNTGFFGRKYATRLYVAQTKRVIITNGVRRGGTGLAIDKSKIQCVKKGDWTRQHSENVEIEALRARWRSQSK